MTSYLTDILNIICCEIYNVIECATVKLYICLKFYLFYHLLIHHFQKSNNNYEVNYIKESSIITIHIISLSLSRMIYIIYIYIYIYIYLTLKIHITMIYVIYAYLNMKSNLLNIPNKRMIYQ